MGKRRQNKPQLKANQAAPRGGLAPVGCAEREKRKGVEAKGNEACGL